MPPNKRKTALSKTHSQPQPSDYETDNANITDTINVLLTPSASTTTAPNQPLRSNTEINLAVLRRYYPSLNSILAIAPFAVVYQYSHLQNHAEGTGGAEGGWEKIGVEGTAFICELLRPDQSSGSAGVTYAIIILNRKRMDNFLLPLDAIAPDDVEMTGEYIILPVLDSGVEEGGTEPKVYGLWIFDENRSRENVAEMIVECALRAEGARRWVQEGGLGTGGGQVPEYDLAGERPGGESDGMWAAQQPGDTQTQGFGIMPSQGFEMSPSQLHMQQQPGTGQQIDLMALFNTPAPQKAPNGFTGEPVLQKSTGFDGPALSQNRQFSATADTDFFRSGPPSGPTPSMQVQHPQPPQQNALLDLFKNAKRG